MSEEFQYDVFLSHNSHDKPAMMWLAKKLVDQAGLRVFLDTWNLVPGDPWQEDLENALGASRTVAVFLGPAGISGWHNQELRSALSTRVNDQDRRVIPVLLPGTTMPEDKEIPKFLKNLTWVDFRDGLNDENAFHRLVAGIKGELPGRLGTPGEQFPKTVKGYKPERGEKENAMSKKDKKEKKVDTGGGAYVGGKVDTGGGDFVGRNKITKAEKGGVAIGGDVSGSTIVTGHGNVVGSTVTLREEYVQQIYTAIDSRPDTSPYEKDDLKEKVEDIVKEDGKGEKADEGFIAHRLQNIKLMAPDIWDVILTTIANPVSGFGMVAKKVAEKMKAEVGGSQASPDKGSPDLQGVG